jgi:hypothetical protein
MNQTVTQLPGQGQLEQQLHLALSYIEDLRETNTHLEERDRQHLEREAELEDELNAERQAHEQSRQTLAMERRRYDDLDSRHTELYLKWANRQKWREQLLANETIPNANCKLVGAYLWENGLESTDGEIQFFKERIAADLACDPGTVSTAIERMKSFDVINVRTEDLMLPDGTKHRNALTYISCNTLADPTQIIMEKKQGAAKPKVCFRDGVTVMNPYTVRHCPVHGEIGLYGQPGLPKETDEMLMVDDFIRKYQMRVPHALSDYRDPITGLLIDTTDTNNETSTSEEKKPSSTALTAYTNAQPENAPHNNITSITNETSTSEEKKPSSTALTSSEDDRWATAEKVLTELNECGLALTYEGGRRLIETSTVKPSKAQIHNLSERIKQYEPEIRTYLSMIADYDQQEAIQMLNTTLPADQQISLEQEKASTQRILLPCMEASSEGGSQ